MSDTYRRAWMFRNRSSVDGDEGADQSTTVPTRLAAVAGPDAWVHRNEFAVGCTIGRCRWYPSRAMGVPPAASGPTAGRPIPPVWCPTAVVSRAMAVATPAPIHLTGIVSPRGRASLLATVRQLLLDEGLEVLGTRLVGLAQGADHLAPLGDLV